MRIVSGKFRGRPITSPKAGSMRIRPTTDRGRESLFNILRASYADKLDGGRVLDLFAGTGGLGFEALSNGASFALFVEVGTEGRGLIRETMHSFGLQGESKLFRRDATKLGPIGTMAPFDLVFADPPYGQQLGELALVELAHHNWLSEDALIVLEESADAPFTMPSGFILIDERRSSSTILRFIRQT